MARYEGTPATGHYELLRLAAKTRGVQIIEHGDGFVGLRDARAVLGLTGTTAPSTSILASRICRSKRLQLHLLRIAGIPVPEGRSFRVDESKEAIDYAMRLGWPVVVKPSGLKGGEGVVVGIRSEHQFRSAWQHATGAISGRRDHEMIVEREHGGLDVRVYVVDGQAVAGTVRLPPYVRGDGRSTVKELVADANRARQAHPDLRRLPIVLDVETDRHLALQALTRESIPRQRRVVSLRRCGNLSLGGVSVDVTDQLPDRLIDMASRAIGLIPGLDAGGVDLLAPDIRTGMDAVVVEVNAAANISMHHFPVVGKPRDVAGAIVDLSLSLFSPTPAAAEDSKGTWSR
jgi:cyanophycin synthetase